MAETWTCGICETVCDGAYCPVCGAVRPTVVADTPGPSEPARSVQPWPAADESIRIRKRATWYYLTFLVVYIILTKLPGLLCEVFPTPTRLAELPETVMQLLLLICNTVAFMKTSFCDSNAENVARGMFVCSTILGVYYIIYKLYWFAYDWMVYIEVLLALLCILFSLQFWRLAKRIPKEQAA